MKTLQIFKKQIILLLAFILLANISYADTVTVRSAAGTCLHDTATAACDSIGELCNDDTSLQFYTSAWQDSGYSCSYSCSGYSNWEYRAVCIKRPDGSSCTFGNQCLNDLCVEGTCRASCSYDNSKRCSRGSSVYSSIGGGLCVYSNAGGTPGSTSICDTGGVAYRSGTGKYFSSCTYALDGGTKYSTYDNDVNPYMTVTAVCALSSTGTTGIGDTSEVCKAVSDGKYRSDCSHAPCIDGTPCDPDVDQPSVSWTPGNYVCMGSNCVTTTTTTTTTTSTTTSTTSTINPDSSSANCNAVHGNGVCDQNSIDCWLPGPIGGCCEVKTYPEDTIVRPEGSLSPGQACCYAGYATLDGNTVSTLSYFRDGDGKRRMLCSDGRFQDCSNYATPTYATHWNKCTRLEGKYCDGDGSGWSNGDGSGDDCSATQDGSMECDGSGNCVVAADARPVVTFNPELRVAAGLEVDDYFSATDDKGLDRLSSYYEDPDGFERWHDYACGGVGDLSCSHYWGSIQDTPGTYQYGAAAYDTGGQGDVVWQNIYVAEACPAECIADDMCSDSCNPNYCGDESGCDCWYSDCDDDCDMGCETRFTCCDVGDACDCDEECPPTSTCVITSGSTGTCASTSTTTSTIACDYSPACTCLQPPTSNIYRECDSVTSNDYLTNHMASRRYIVGRQQTACLGGCEFISGTSTGSCEEDEYCSGTTCGPKSDVCHPCPSTCDGSCFNYFSCSDDDPDCDNKNLGAPCCDTSNCAQGSCVGGICCMTNGQTCTNGGNCCSGYCIEGTCRESCENYNGDICSTGSGAEVWNLHGGRCLYTDSSNTNSVCQTHGGCTKYSNYYSDCSLCSPGDQCVRPTYSIRDGGIPTSSDPYGYYCTASGTCEEANDPCKVANNRPDGCPCNAGTDYCASGICVEGVCGTCEGDTSSWNDCSSSSFQYYQPTISGICGKGSSTCCMKEVCLNSNDNNYYKRCSLCNHGDDCAIDTTNPGFNEWKTTGWIGYTCQPTGGTEPCPGEDVACPGSCGGSCFDSTHCAISEFRCMCDPPGPLGDSCGFNSDCPDSYCDTIGMPGLKPNLCVPKCTAQGNACPPGYECNAGTCECTGTIPTLECTGVAVTTTTSTTTTIGGCVAAGGFCASSQLANSAPIAGTCASGSCYECNAGLYHRVQEDYSVAYPISWGSGQQACCSSDNHCVDGNGNCVLGRPWMGSPNTGWVYDSSGSGIDDRAFPFNGDSDGDATNEPSPSYCTWLDCDQFDHSYCSGSSVCGPASDGVESGESAAFGEYPAGAPPHTKLCCGDDAGENYRTCETGVNEFVQGADCGTNNDACCNANDCVDHLGICRAANSCYAFDGKYGYCNGGNSWQDPDAGSGQYCNSPGCPVAWDVAQSGELAAFGGYPVSASAPHTTECCGDDASENLITTQCAGATATSLCCNSASDRIGPSDTCVSSCCKSNWGTCNVASDCCVGYICIDTADTEVQGYCRPLTSCSSYGGHVCSADRTDISPTMFNSGDAGVCARDSSNVWSCDINSVSRPAADTYYTSCYEATENYGASIAGEVTSVIPCDDNVNPSYSTRGICARSSGSPFCDWDGGICRTDGGGYDIYRSYCGLCNNYDPCDISSTNGQFNPDGECRSGNCAACGKATTVCASDTNCCNGYHCSDTNPTSGASVSAHCCLDGYWWNPLKLGADKCDPAATCSTIFDPRPSAEGHDLGVDPSDPQHQSACDTFDLGDPANVFQNVKVY